MPPIPDLSKLTHSIMLGISMGTVALTQVGCTEAGMTQLSGAAATGEQEACARALASKAPADVDAVLDRFPSSNCIPPLLGAMPPATLAALSPDALRGLSLSVANSIPAAVRAQLPVRLAAVPSVGARRDNDDDNDRGGY